MFNFLVVTESIFIMRHRRN